MNSQNTTPRYLTCAETAKLVRAELKAQFPGIKFSVRSDNYAGGAAIRVSWANGPTETKVRALTHRYRCSDFDGMTDSSTSRPATLLAGPDGAVEEVYYGADFISGSRTLTPEYESKLRAEAAKICGTSDLGWHTNVPAQETPYGWFRGGTVWTLINWLSEHIPS